MTGDDGVRRAVRLREPARDLDEELAFHFEQVVTELESSGLSRADAEAEAKRRFGDEERYRHELATIDRQLESRVRWRDRFDAAGDSVKYALRSMRRSPGLAGGIILAFALGIGANATVYGLIDRLLLRAPPHLEDPASLRIIAAKLRWPQQDKDIHDAIRSYPELADFAGARSLAGIAGFNFSPHEFVLGRGADAQRVRGMSVTGGYFPLIGVRPALGRLIGPEDDRRDAPGVAVLSHGFWQLQYGGARDVIGRTIDLGRGPQTIIGVLPARFTGVQLVPIDVWIPMTPHRTALQGDDWDKRRENYWLTIVVRLKPGVTTEAAEAELTTLHRAAYAEQIAVKRYPADVKVLAASLIPGESPLAPPEIGVTRWLAAVALVVLLVACINIANLLLARAIRERRALGIRLALGVTRARLIGQILVEVTLFALIGGVAALLVARYGGALVQRVLMPEYAWDTLGFDPSMLLVTLGLALVAGLVACALPALQMLRPGVLDALRASAGAGVGRGTRRLRSGLVAAQVALSVVLLSGAALFLRSFSNAVGADLGVDLRSAFYLTLDFDEGEDFKTLHARGLAALANVPGIEAAGASSTMPLFHRHGLRMRAEGWDSIPGRVYVHAIAGDYFGAVGLRTLQGRGFEGTDGAGTEPVAVVNRVMGATLYPVGALGHCLWIGKDATRCTRIVGITEDALIDGIGGKPAMQLYIASVQQPDAPQLWGFPVRVANDVPVAHVLSEAKRALVGIGPNVRSVDITPFEEMIDRQLRPWRLGATLFSCFGALALLVAVLGLYGTIAFDVSQRARELGLRAALGATPRGLQRMVVRAALAVTGMGLAVGLAVSLVFAPRLEALLFHVAPRDVSSLAAISAILLVVAVFAALLPSRRAARVDPLTALRIDA